MSPEAKLIPVYGSVRKALLDCVRMNMNKTQTADFLGSARLGAGRWKMTLILIFINAAFWGIFSAVLGFRVMEDWKGLAIIVAGNLSFLVGLLSA